MAKILKNIKSIMLVLNFIPLYFNPLKRAMLRCSLNFGNPLLNEGHKLFLLEWR